ncbi:hypothetical protein C8Q75DRAFT_784008 [Abortiporus biennis]|nr:hypothetical protein C8Q75DRAFT_784008 [Abortiporus biennis]
MAKGKKGGLKAALSSQQARLKKKQEAKEAAQIAEQKTKSKSKGKSKVTTRSPTIPFKPTDLILLVGEGNFSFARALVVDPPSTLEHLPAENVWATAYDSEEECYTKYPDAMDIVKTIRQKGVQVIFSVDGTKLEKCAALRGKTFDRIVWNFPHVGKGITDQDRNILSNQILLLGFFTSCSKFLCPGPVPVMHVKKKKKSPEDDEDESKQDDNEEEDLMGSSDTIRPRGTVLVTLRNVSPYTLWDLPKLAKDPPPAKSSDTPEPRRYVQLRSFAFQRSVWKGYEHRMTKGERAHGQGTTGIGGEDRTWEFYLRPRDREPR